MDTTEKDARKRHGNFLFDITWRARKTEQKWLWFVVVIVSTLRLTALNIIIFAFAGVLSGWVYHDQLLWTSAVSGAFAGLVTSPVIEPLFRPHWTISAISSYYSVAADMKRSPKGFGRKVLYLVTGGAAVVLAMLVLMFHRKKMITEEFYITELDVLGNVFSKAGQWKLAREIFHEMESRHYDCPHTGNEKRQCAISYALACKWLIDDPTNSKHLKNELKGRISEVMASYPDLPEEVTMRLKEAFK